MSDDKKIIFSMVGVNKYTPTGKHIIKDVYLSFYYGAKIGILGMNGAGKSTVMKIIAGLDQSYQGDVVWSPGYSVGYLPQEPQMDETKTVREIVEEGVKPITDALKEYEEINNKFMDEEILNDPEKMQKLMDRQAEVQDKIEVLGGWDLDTKLNIAMDALRCPPEDAVIGVLSGGERRRVALCRLLLQQPDVLLLDEPTNHLDLPSIEWLEKYLIHYQGAVIIVSHDKFFLDRMVNKIVELYQRKLHIYSGNYTYYIQEKELRMEMQQRAFENQQDFIRQQERFIERFKAKASKAAQAQSIQKRLDKIERVEEASIERPNIRINFSIEKNPGKVICTLKGIKKNFGKIQILDGGDAEIERGDKIALIGANGKGKSTLLRIIADRETFEGERVWGHNVEESFYAQHQLESLKLDNNLIEELQMAGSKKTDLELRTILGCFLFGGDDVDKKIRVLSGGEKARVALAKTIISKSNFLMLDEPTNHLDMHSVDLLAEALDKYEGSLILVSHDRYFISKAANKIWEIVDGKIVEFKGGYQEWVEWKERMEKLAKQQENNAKQSVQPDKKKEVKPEPVAQPAPVQNNAIDKEKQKEKKRLQRQFEELEKKISELKSQKTAIEAALADPGIYSDMKKFQETEQQYNKVNAELQQAEKQYEVVFEGLMDES